MLESVNRPLVSIVTVSYNQGSYLRECMESVFSQTYPQIEYIVMDGGSRDESPQIIKSFAERLAYWRVVPDNGPAEALGEGFQKATGAIFAYLNSDDLLKPWAVERWVDVFQKNPEVDLAYGDISFIDSQGNPARFPGGRVSTFRTAPWDLRSYAAGISVIPQQGVAWKRKVYETVGGFNRNNQTCWDAEFFAAAAMAGFRFGQIPEVLACFRIHSESISGSHRLADQYAIDFQKIIETWRIYGIKVSAFERFLRRWIVRFQRFLRQPSAFFSTDDFGRERESRERL